MQGSPLGRAIHQAATNFMQTEVLTAMQGDDKLLKVTRLSTILWTALSIAIAREGASCQLTQEDLAAGASHQLRGRLAMSNFDRGIVPQRGLEEVGLPSPRRQPPTLAGTSTPPPLHARTPTRCACPRRSRTSCARW